LLRLCISAQAIAVIAIIFVLFVAAVRTVLRRYWLILPEEELSEVFLSYAWGRNNENHNRVKMIDGFLSRNGIKCWIDSRCMRGDMKNCITNAVGKIKIFIIFLTIPYNEKIANEDSKDFCYYEFNYATQVLSTSQMIIVNMDKETRNQKKWAKRLQADFGNHLFIDLSNLHWKKSLDKQPGQLADPLYKLLDHIQIQLKRKAKIH
jgi:hypothetical protein